MGTCWEARGCDDEMASRCPHAISSTDGLCVAGCYYTRCSRPQHKTATSFDLLLDATVDRGTAVMETCTFCEFFLENAPRISQAPKAQEA